MYDCVKQVCFYQQTLREIATFSLALPSKQASEALRIGQRERSERKESVHARERVSLLDSKNALSLKETNQNQCCQLECNVKFITMVKSSL